MAITVSQGGDRYAGSSSIEVRKIDGSAPNRWLAKGIDDLKVANIHSLLYGLVFVVAGAVTIWFTQSNPFFVMAIVAGFYLVGPPVAAGLYDMSQSIERGEKPSLMHAISVLGRNTRCLLGMALLLGTLMVVWTGVAMLLVNLFLGDSAVLSGGWQSMIAGDQTMPFAGVLLIGGIIMAVLASALSLTVLPLLNQRQIGTITVLVILAAVILAWVRMMVLAINAFLDNPDAIASGWNSIFSQPEFLPFMAAFLLTGLVFAGIAFAISVVAVPMIIDRKVGIGTAISTSIEAVRKNPGPMLRWAATIAVLMAVGVGFFFIGLVIVLPIIGHASWHAYRELVVQEK